MFFISEVGHLINLDARKKTVRRFISARTEVTAQTNDHWNTVIELCSHCAGICHIYAISPSHRVRVCERNFNVACATTTFHRMPLGDKLKHTSGLKKFHNKLTTIKWTDAHKHISNDWHRYNRELKARANNNMFCSSSFPCYPTLI